MTWRVFWALEPMAWSGGFLVILLGQWSPFLVKEKTYSRILVMGPKVVLLGLMP